MRQVVRWGGLSMAAVLLATAACGRSHVVREPAHARADRPAPRERPVRISQPRYGATAVVQRGQTLYRIANDNGITALDLALWNDIPPPYTIHPGQRLRLYPGRARSAAAARPASTPPRQAQPSAARPAPVVRDVAPPPSSRLAWRWPADGAVVQAFSAGDPTRQGVGIAGRAGQPVRAAADGVVVYSGAGLVGYGELVIVKHDDRWLSAYGHNRARLVNEGHRVKAGEQIAEMGRTGAAREMLHFEIRHNGKPVDPQQYLPKR